MTDTRTPRVEASATDRASDRAAADSGLTVAELAELAGVAREAAMAGGERLNHHFGRLSSVREKGRAGDLVTEADLAAEAVVLELLASRTPELGVMAEESGLRPGARDGLRWCVDPLDGTTNYAHGYPFFGCSVGLLWHDTPLLGALAVPAMGDLYWAAPGHGAWRNGQRIHVSDGQELGEALLVTGFAYDRISRIDNNYAEFAWFTHRTRGVRRAGAAAVDLACVACGCLDGYWERGLSPWDLAAGVVLVEQAGGVVRNYDGGPLDLLSGRLIACTPLLLQAMVDGLARCQPLQGAAYGAPELDR